MLHVDAGIEILIFIKRSNKILDPGKAFLFNRIDDAPPYFSTFGDVPNNIAMKIVKFQPFGHLLGDETAAAPRFHAQGNNRYADLGSAVRFCREAFPFSDLLFYKFLQ